MNEVQEAKAGTDPKTCEHWHFAVRSVIHRLTEREGGPATGFMMDVSAYCSDCGTPFLFKGLPVGYSPRKPMVSFSREEMRAPIEAGRKRDLS